MNTITKVLLVFVLGLVVTGTGLVMWGVGTHNTYVSLEESIKAQYSQNQNNYDNFYKSVSETMQLTDAYSDDFKKVYDSLMQGRYGDGGSKAVMQWIQENMPQMDSSVYTKVQDAILAGRRDFEQNQKILLDKKRVYEQELRVVPKSLLAGFMGFPKIDLAQYGIVTSDKTEEAFKSKKAEPLKLRN